jgi:hypothetical protein
MVNGYAQCAQKTMKHGEIMATYMFEIQSLIKVPVVAENKRVARENLTDNLSSFADEMIQDCSISDGEEVV